MSATYRIPRPPTSRAIGTPARLPADAGPVDGPGREILQQDVRSRIASPEMFPEAKMLPHLICSRPMFIGGAKDEADQHGSARRVGGSDSRAVCARGPG